MEISTWTYVSRSCIAKGDAEREVEHLVEQSRLSNARLRVTGVLVFSGTHFAQYIEGPRQSIAELRSAIQSDGRHQDVMTVSEAQIEARKLADWSLAYSGASRVVSRAIHRAIHEAERRDAAAATTLLSTLLQLAAPKE
jgi:hypothetical protein